MSFCREATIWVQFKEAGVNTLHPSLSLNAAIKCERMGQLLDDFRKQIVACQLRRRWEFIVPQNQQRANYFTPSLLDSMHLEVVIRVGVERARRIPPVWIKYQECPLMFRKSRGDPPLKKLSAFSPAPCVKKSCHIGNGDSNTGSSSCHKNLRWIFLSDLQSFYSERAGRTLLLFVSVLLFLKPRSRHKNEKFMAEWGH